MKLLLCFLFLGPFAVLYRVIASLRNRFYDYGWLQTYSCKIHVISVGNLTAGGTGKTPFTLFLLGQLAQKGLSVAVASRGYGGSFQGVQKVEPGAGAALRYGDEPTLIASRFPQVPVFVGTDRVAVCQHIVKEGSAKVVIADDAFQHRRLKRDCDIVLLDATEPLHNYAQLPLGRARESLSGLRRAQAVIVTKVNIAGEEKTQKLREILDQNLQRLRAKPLRIEMKSVLTGLCDLEGNSLATSDFCERVLLVAGIAQPENFRVLVELEFKVKIEGLRGFPDHHNFSPSDFVELERECEAKEIRFLLTTEKDAVKMKNWRPKAITVLTARLGFLPVASSSAQTLNTMDELYEKIVRL